MRRGFEPRMVQTVCDELCSRPRWLLETSIGLSVPRFPAPHTLAAFSIRPRIHFGRLPRLDWHITDCFHQHHYIVPHPSQRRLTAPTVQFSAGIFVLCVARRSRTHHPGATRQLVEPTRLELVAS